MTSAETMHVCQQVSLLVGASVVIAAVLGALGTAMGRSLEDHRTDIPPLRWDDDSGTGRRSPNRRRPHGRGGSR
jgi:hypothetical protein